MYLSSAANYRREVDHFNQLFYARGDSLGTKKYLIVNRNLFPDVFILLFSDLKIRQHLLEYLARYPDFTYAKPATQSLLEKSLLLI